MCQIHVNASEIWHCDMRHSCQFVLSLWLQCHELEGHGVESSDLTRILQSRMQDLWCTYTRNGWLCYSGVESITLNIFEHCHLQPCEGDNGFWRFRIFTLLVNVSVSHSLVAHTLPSITPPPPQHQNHGEEWCGVNVLLFIFNIHTLSSQTVASN